MKGSNSISCPKAPPMTDKRVHLHPFDLDLLTDTFQLRETTSADLPLAGIGLPSGASNLKNEYK